MTDVTDVTDAPEAGEVLAAGCDLGRLEGRRAATLGRFVAVLVALELLGDTKVGDLQHSVDRHHQVGWLHVAVYHALGVAVLEADKELPRTSGRSQRSKHGEGLLARKLRGWR